MKDSLLDIMTLEELNATFKLKKDWVYQHIHAGDLPFPHFKLGNQLRFRKQDILDFVEREIGKTKARNLRSVS